MPATALTSIATVVAFKNRDTSASLEEGVGVIGLDVAGV